MDKYGAVTRIPFIANKIPAVTELENGNERAVVLILIIRQSLAPTSEQ